MLIPFLFSLLNDYNLENAKTLTKKGSYEQSASVLATFKPDSKQYNDYHFYQLVNAFSMNNKEAAVKEIDLLQDSFNLTRRQQHLMFLMAFDLKLWKNDDIGDISRDMKHVTARINNLDAGKKTREIQDELTKKLAKLIENIENDRDKAQQAAKDREKEQQQKQQQGNNPLDDFKLPEGSNKGLVDSKKMRELAEVWGKLPEKERTQAMLELTRDLPPRYKEVIEQYFKTLALKQK